MLDELAMRVLRAIEVGMDSTTGLAVALNEERDDVHETVSSLVDDGFVTKRAPDGGLALTEAGVTVVKLSEEPPEPRGIFGRRFRAQR